MTTTRALLLVLLAGAAACSAAPVTRCENDGQCNLPGENFKRCDVETGVCLCNEQRGCARDEICNPLGRCQAISGCVTNDECQAAGQENLFCDTRTNQCMSMASCDPAEGETCCTLDSHCPYDHICSQLEKKCIPGCKDNGDCRIGEGCVGAGFGRVGLCAAGTCTASNLCQYGEVCNLDVGDCVFDTRGPYCFSCTGGVASDDCGEHGNYCLTDTSDPTGRSSFCGVDCSQGQPCPFGYECHDVIIIPPQAPFCSPPELCVKDEGAESGLCSFSGTACSVDEDCPVGPPGSDCPRAHVGNCVDDQTKPCEQDSECCTGADCPEHSCVKQECRGREAGAFGHCTCTRDADCPRDRCLDADLTDPANPVRGYCELSGHDCFEELDCDTIACVEGGCLIGSNCAPANDRTCREVAIPQQELP